MSAKKSPFSVKCKPCGHEWVAGYLPMDIGKFSKLCMGMHCPMCGAGATNIFPRGGEGLAARPKPS